MFSHTFFRAPYGFYVLNSSKTPQLNSRKDLVLTMARKLKSLTVHSRKIMPGILESNCVWEDIIIVILALT